MQSRDYNINLRGEYNPITAVYLSQYDSGVELHFHVYDGTEPAGISGGAEISIMGRRPSGVGFDIPCTVVSNNLVIVSTTTDMTGEAGTFPVEIRFSRAGTDIGTVNFDFVIEKAPHPDGTIDADITHEQEFIERLEALEENTVTDSTLSISGRPADAAATGAAITSEALELTRYMRRLFKTKVSHSATTGVYENNNTRNAITVPQRFTYPVRIVADAGYSFAVQTYSSDVASHDSYISNTAWESDYTVPANTYFCMIARNNNNTDADDTISNAIHFLADTILYGADSLIPKTDYLFIRWARSSSNANNATKNGGSNAAYTFDNIITAPAIIEPAEGLALYIQLFSGNTYVGKINSSYGVDRVAGNWGVYTGNINVQDIFDQFAAYNVDGLKLSFNFPSGTTSNYATVDALANNLVKVNVSPTASKSDLNDRTAKETPVIWHKGTLTAENLVNNQNGVVNYNILPMPQKITLTGCRAVVLLFRADEYIGKINASGTLDKVAGSWKYFYGTIYAETILDAFNADGMRVCAIPTDDTTITADTAQSYADAHIKVYLNPAVNWAYNTRACRAGGNYVVGADLIKRGIAAKQVGWLTYKQAFCIYDGKYYSIDGSNIAEQDQNFNLLRSNALNTGHGNSLQVGTGGKAYASGWDDNNIYVVDLSSLTITETISLPTTGYTTCVVDELRGLIYIFQRDSLPDTEANYNFITYDYINDAIISTKKTLPFAAIQACDLYNDKIIALNGLGTNGAPNGYRVYGISGEILAEYVLNAFASIEPEGVCIDRDSKELYISFVNGNIYSLTD